MMASRLLRAVESWGLTLSVTEGQLVVTGRPSRNVQLLIGLYREPLLAVLRGEDRPLTASHPRAELLALGFIEWRLPDGTRRWVHNDGDEVADRILLGGISWDTARAAQAGRTAQARTLLGREGFIQRRRP